MILTPLPLKSTLLRARVDRVLRITASDEGQSHVLQLEGDANAAVSQVLVMTSHELFPAKVAAWDDE